MKLTENCICNQPSGLKKIKELADYLKIISDENRLKILCMLKDGERCVCEIYEPLSLPQNLISHHLKVLKAANLVHSKKQGKWIHYKINEKKLKKLNDLYLALLKQNPENRRSHGQCHSEDPNVTSGNEESRNELRSFADAQDDILNTEKIKILFLCTGNSARSQIAEGWTKTLKGKQIEAYSAGVEVQGLNPLAVEVMAESGVDISNQRSKLVDEVMKISFDYVITLCDNAKTTCPVFPGKVKVVHVSFSDPAKVKGLQSLKLQAFRQTRDKIKEFISNLHDVLKELN